MNQITVNIRGCNGAGKSSIPMSMLDDPEMFVVEKPYKNKLRKIATVFPTYGWVAMGTYFNKTGGLDGFPDTNLTKKAFWYLLKKYPGYNLLLEGVIASTVFSTYAELFKEAQKKYPERGMYIISLLPPIENCLRRIQKRNGGKVIKEELVANKWRSVQRNVEKFKAEGLASFAWDNRGCKKKGKPKLIHQLENLIQNYNETPESPYYDSVPF